MSKASLVPLQALLEREQEERDAAQARMLEQRSQADQARRQDNELQQYRKSYGERWTQQFRSSCTPQLLGCYSSFMQRLDQAIAQQRALVGHAEQREAAALEALRECELRLASVRKLIERKQQSLQRAEQRAEQRQSDEQAQRSHARKTPVF